MEIKVVLFDGNIKNHHEASSLDEACRMCRRHLGVSRLMQSMLCGMGYIEELQDEGWTEVRAWDDNSDGYGKAAAIYKR